MMALENNEGRRDMSEIESKRIFQKKFNQLLEERQITQKEVAGICNASTSTVSTWSNGTNMPRMDKIERLANHFGLPKSYFIEEEPASISGSRLSVDEAIKIYSSLSDAQKEKAKDYLRYLKAQEDNQ